MGIKDFCVGPVHLVQVFGYMLRDLRVGVSSFDSSFVLYSALAHISPFLLCRPPRGLGMGFVYGVAPFIWRDGVFEFR